MTEKLMKVTTTMKPLRVELKKEV